VQRLVVETETKLAVSKIKLQAIGKEWKDSCLSQVRSFTRS